MKIISDGRQEDRVLDVLKAANGAWVNGQHFLRGMFLSQYHRAIWNLQHKRERYRYDGDIEASDFKDEHGFKSYRLIAGKTVMPCQHDVLAKGSTMLTVKEAEVGMSVGGQKVRCSSCGFESRWMMRSEAIEPAKLL